MKRKYLPFLGALLLAACSSSAANDSYTLTVDLTPDLNKETAFLLNYDNGEKIDSTMVENGKALFKGTIDAPVVARIVVNGKRSGTLILEPGQLTFQRNGNVTGSPLNAELEKVEAAAESFQARASKLPQDSTYTVRIAALEKEYNHYMDSVVNANATNPIGYMCFMDMAYEYDMPTLQAALKKYPAMKKYTRVNKLLESLKNKELTQPGHKFIDFTITNDTIQQSLSDYVGKGRYTLVDFWASWCGPCIRETKVLKKIREEFEGQNLDILGVAVWDEPQNTEAAIKRHQLPWPQIINAQSIPTDLYGIPAIPCIILFGPDGTILSRDKQGDELIQSVRDALNPQPAEAVK
jgi:thiol-disulfide isomerase/thioredoxin